MTWKNEFRTLLLEQTGESFQKAIELKDANAPESLFKFFRPDEWAFKNLTEGTVYLASPDQFNDPYDSGLTMDGLPSLVSAAESYQGPELEALANIGLTKEDFVDLILGRLDPAVLDNLKKISPDSEREDLERLVAVFPELLRRLNQKFVDERLQPFFQKGLKVACFTERADSLLLWAHYAQQHQGFCVEYGYGELPEDAPQRRLLFPVLYESERFDFATTIQRFASLTPNLVPSHAILAALHKAPDWAYEHEWRIVNPDGRENGFTVPMVKPRAVHAGLKMAPRDRQRLEAICLERGLPLLTPRLSSTEYKLELFNERRTEADTTPGQP